MKRVACALLILLGACGGDSETQPAKPPEDQALVRHEQAGKIAYDLDRPDEAVAQFEAALTQAQARDDLQGDRRSQLQSGGGAAARQPAGGRAEDHAASARRADPARQPAFPVVAAGGGDGALSPRSARTGRRPGGRGRRSRRCRCCSGRQLPARPDRGSSPATKPRCAPLRAAGRGRRRRCASPTGWSCSAPGAAPGRFRQRAQTAGLQAARPFARRGWIIAAWRAPSPSRRRRRSAPASANARPISICARGRSAAAQADADTAKPWLQHVLGLTQDPATEEAADLALDSLE